MNKDQPIVVCGAGGFIGGHMVARLTENGATNVLAVDIKPLQEWFQIPSHGLTARWGGIDLRHPRQCELVCQRARGGILYNFAANMGGMGFIESHRAECMESVLINANLLRQCKENGVRQYFFASSACVYNSERQSGKAAGTALKESDAYPEAPEAGYGHEKLFSEHFVDYAGQDWGIDARVARFHNVYGEHGSWKGGREKAPAAICRKIAEAVLTGRHVINVWGDGRQLRSFMHVDDCVEGVIRLMDHTDFRGPVNLGSSELVSIEQLVELVESIAGIQCARSYDFDAPKGVQGRNSDNTLIKEKLGWEPQISLRDGLTKTYAWIFEQVKVEMESKKVEAK